VKYKKEAFDFWGEQLPKVVKMRKTVRPDVPFLFSGPLLRCVVGECYEVELNPYGAVYVRFPNGTLGLKPGEFDVVENFIPDSEEQ